MSEPISPKIGDRFVFNWGDGKGNRLTLDGTLTFIGCPQDGVWSVDVAFGMKERLWLESRAAVKEGKLE